MKNTFLVLSVLFALFAVTVLFYLPFLYQKGLVLTLEGIFTCLIAPAGASLGFYFLWENNNTED